jgi:hypothetical protein
MCSHSCNYCSCMILHKKECMAPSKKDLGKRWILRRPTKGSILCHAGGRTEIRRSYLIKSSLSKSIITKDRYMPRTKILSGTLSESYKILSWILVRFLLKILSRKMASESDQNLIWNLTRNPSVYSWVLQSQ